MNWDAIGAVAEAVGAATVVVTLVYFTLQLRQNTRSVRANIEQQIANGISGTLNSEASTRIPQLWLRATEGMNKLSEPEMAQFGFFVLSYLKQFEQAYIQYRSGNLSQASWEAIDWQFRATVLSSKGVQDYWESRQGVFNTMFQEYVRAIPLEDIPGGFSSLQMVKNVKEPDAL